MLDRLTLGLEEFWWYFHWYMSLSACYWSIGVSEPTIDKLLIRNFIVAGLGLAE